ncbi:hypothetical protein JEG43_01315 [Anoxybacillus sp. LAT_35]|uniref:hypothetical protein n=1 Tax=Anoxybacillus TaxID=150247 RepID=UPI001EDBCE22|nr:MULTISPECIES: hypothetical protein [Anoxybacillus]MCG5025023.1 hypothetical protein [Anoxybacillus flavithermus]MCG6198702.1 hypothetical protein [Anoxybacillus sp. LAT_38]MCG3085219.1 hypothetical protein [Anoxybacillus sp. LAT27]MCG6173180.1 hypothetical protein [Anoxybacillus sp. LAT_11]MCG6176152.1 hypothetical protein [Anoxybacillus sp. LAT_31]
MKGTLDELHEITNKLYRIETHQAMQKWKSAFEKIYIHMEEYDRDINKSDVLEIIRLIVFAMENKDYILMADLIRYELIPLLSN